MAIKVLVVDDSALVRKTIVNELTKDPGIEVIGTAPDPFVARDMIVALKPDVLTLDIEMPRMDGLSFLARLMKHHPIPVIIVSSVAKSGSANAVQALMSGAVAVIAKPGSAYSASELGEELCHEIKSAANVDMKRVLRKMIVTPGKQISSLARTTDKVLLIGASTGGTAALETLLTSFPANAPGTAIVQHMPAGFTKSFADRLNSICKVEVKEAEDGDQIFPGRVLIAPGNEHMSLKRSGTRYSVEVKPGPLVNRHRPSVGVLFDSGAEHLGRNGIGLMLTGMGQDGAEAMKRLHEAGATCIAQDEETSVVYGMPKAAVEKGAVDIVLPLTDISDKVMSLC